MSMAGARSGTIRRVAAVCATPAIGLVVASCGDPRSTIDETTRDAAGAVVEAGEVGVFQLQVGDCVLLPEATAEPSIDRPDGTAPPPAPGRAETLVAVPCAEPHTGEVVLVDQGFFDGSENFPGEAAAFESAAEACIEALEEYTREVYGFGPLDYFSLVPTEESWETVDDRELVCIGLTLDDTLTRAIETTGSLRAA
jgi:hypothetical protein